MSSRSPPVSLCGPLHPWLLVGLGRSESERERDVWVFVSLAPSRRNSGLFGLDHLSTESPCWTQPLCVVRLSLLTTFSSLSWAPPFLKKKLLKYSLFTMFVNFCCIAKWIIYIHTYIYIYIYPFFFRLFSYIGHYRVLRRVPCAVR